MRNVRSAHDQTHKSSVRRRWAPNVPPYVAPPAEAAHRPLTAEDLAADPEFQQWAAEERAAELGVLTARAHR